LRRGRAGHVGPATGLHRSRRRQCWVPATGPARAGRAGCHAASSRGSLTRRRHSEMILCDDHTQDNRGYGRAQPAPATRTPASHRPPDPRSPRGDRRFPAGTTPPMREGGVSMRPRRTAWTLPVLVAAGRSPDPDALRSSRTGRTGAGGGEHERCSRVRTGRDLGDQLGTAQARAPQLTADVRLGGPGDAGGKHVGRRGRGRGVPR